MSTTLADATFDQPYDFGHGVTGYFVGWAPDLELNPQYDGIPDEPRYGVILNHPTPAGGPCSSCAVFDGETVRRLEPNRPVWTVQSWEPLTISPSVLCRACGHHGFIRDGKWVPA
jgi:hypothetical protein